MSLELTARLTLSSCVSQLTDFYTTNIMQTLLDNGHQEMHIKLVTPDGEVIPYKIVLEPIKNNDYHFQVDGLVACVCYEEIIAGYSSWKPQFHARVTRNAMSTSNLYKCALHVCGDFIKFNEKGL